MESTPPPVPTLISPEPASRVKRDTYLDWADVNDDSKPVTYTLQIAADANFASILLHQTDLSDSDYTLSGEERLPVNTEAPYYWRVRATDAAGNQSPWSQPAAFYVGVSFPEWAKYVAIGLGVILVGLVSFWFGWRTRQPKPPAPPKEVQEEG